MVEEGLLEEHERGYGQALLWLLQVAGWEIAITHCAAGVRISARSVGCGEIVLEGASSDEVTPELFKAAVAAGRRARLRSVGR